MLKRFLVLMLVLAFASPAGAIKYKGDLESNESITFPEQATKPTSPATTKHKLYFKDDGGPYFLNSSGSENPMLRAGLKNAVINGNFDIWQRGTSFTEPANNAYTADRWGVSYNGTGMTRTVSRQAFALGQTDVPGEPEFYLRNDVTVAGTGQTFNQLTYKIEDVRTFAGQVVTVSFYAKADVAVSLVNPSAIFQQFGSGGTPSAQVNALSFGTPSLTTAWQRFTFTGTLPSISGKTLGTDNNNRLAVVLSIPNNTVRTIDIAQMQIEKGSVATAFEKRPPALELALAQRYYEKQTVQTINGDVWITWHAVKRGMPTTSTTAGTLNNTTADGSRLNHNASAAATLTADAEL